MRDNLETHNATHAGGGHSCQAVEPSTTHDAWPAEPDSFATVGEVDVAGIGGDDEGVTVCLVTHVPSA